MSKTSRLLLFPFLALLLVGCASLPAKNPAHNKVVDWSERREALANIHSWVLRGSMGIQSPNKKGTVSVYWKQQGDQFSVRLFGPLGAGSVKVEGNGGAVTLTDSQGRQQSAPTPEALLQRTLGWQIPIREMIYWIRGLPAPNQPAAITLDKYQRSQQFHQRGWTIRYQRYTAMQDHDLPSILTLDRGDIHVKFILRKWVI